MNPVTFDLVVPTYNRHELLKKTLQSLIQQTYAHFHVHVLDDGSDPPIRSIVDELKDSRFDVIRYSENLHPAEILEDSINRFRGDYFLCVEDDNGLVPTALERVASVLRGNSKIEILGTNFIHFNHSRGTARHINSEQFTRDLFSESAELVLWRFCAAWGIGPKQAPPLPSHFSAIYFRNELLRKAKNRFGKVFFKPLGDVSLLSLFGLVEKTWYLDLPLSYIGEHDGQITNASKSGQRQRLENSIWLKDFIFEHSPLSGLSYSNLAVDCHLAAVYRLGWQNDERAKLQSTFFESHFASVRSDRPWTKRTWVDVFEVIPFISLPRLIMSFFHLRIRKVVKFVLRKDRFVEGNLEKLSDIEHEFDDCVKFALWIDQNILDEKQE